MPQPLQYFVPHLRGVCAHSREKWHCHQVSSELIHFALSALGSLWFLGATYYGVHGTNSNTGSCK